MSSDAGQPPPSLRIARSVLDREAGPADDNAPAALAAAMQRTCTRVSDNLRDSLGPDGCSALLARSFARSAADHPSLNDVCRLSDGGVHIDGVLASIDSHGLPAVTAGIEALLAALLEVLIRLIGEDMAIRIIDHGAPRSRIGGGAQAP